MTATAPTGTDEREHTPIEELCNATESLMNWCLKNVDKWDFPQFDNASRQLAKVRASLRTALASHADYCERCATVHASIDCPPAGDAVQVPAPLSADAVAAITAYGDARADEAESGAALAQAITVIRKWGAAMAPEGHEPRCGFLAPDYCKGFADGQAALHPAGAAQVPSLEAIHAALPPVQRRHMDLLDIDTVLSAIDALSQPSQQGTK